VHGGVMFKTLMAAASVTLFLRWVWIFKVVESSADLYDLFYWFLLCGNRAAANQAKFLWKNQVFVLYIYHFSVLYKSKIEQCVDIWRLFQKNPESGAWHYRQESNAQGMVALHQLLYCNQNWQQWRHKNRTSTERIRLRQW